jgi:hypothetical protein
VSTNPNEAATAENSPIGRRRLQLVAGGVVAAIIIAAVLLIATSGSDSTVDTSPTGVRPSGQGTQGAALEKCFAKYGLAPADAKQHGGNPSPTLEKAMAECQKYLGGKPQH